MPKFITRARQVRNFRGNLNEVFSDIYHKVPILLNKLFKIVGPVLRYVGQHTILVPNKSSRFARSQESFYRFLLSLKSHPRSQKSAKTPDLHLRSAKRLSEFYDTKRRGDSSIFSFQLDNVLPTLTPKAHFPDQ